MALGKQNKIEGKAYSLKLKLKDGANFLEVPQFEVREKQDGKYVVIGKETDVAGDLLRVETRLGDYEGQPIRNVSLTLKDFDKNEVYYVEFGLGSGLGRSLANSVLNLQGADNVQLGLYGQKNKESGKTYPAASLRQGDSNETVKWKYNPKEENSPLPAIREFKGKGGKIEKDATAVEEFLFEKIKKFGEEVLPTLPRRAAAPKQAPSQHNDHDAPEQGSEDVSF